MSVSRSHFCNLLSLSVLGLTLSACADINVTVGVSGGDGGGGPTEAQLQAMTATQNGGGGSGAELDTGLGSSFVLFQSDWVSKLVNRDGGGVQAAGVNALYSIGAYRDPNDGYDLKFFAVDRGNHRVLIFNSIPNSGAAVPDVVVGQADMTTGTVNGGLGAVNGAGLNSPVFVSVCTDGKMFIADQANHRVLGFNQVPTANGASADFVIGQADLTTGVSGTSATALRNPYAAHCMGGKLFVLDRGNHRVLVYSSVPSSNLPAASYAIGQPDLTTGSSGCTANKLNTPYESGTHDGKLYVADGGNHRILVFTDTGSGNPAAETVIGQTLFTSCAINQGGGVSASTLHWPNSFNFSSDEVMAVSDHSNSRVLFFSLPLSTGGAAFAQIGQTDLSSNTPYDPPSEGTVTTTKGLIFDDGYIWIGDSGNKRVQALPLPY
ncbi:MAG: NHL repeat-containing protein [Bdellovibrionales bacterium]|nr:NHL repeat-containing protein [Bdellovibrionales bacterium]